MLINTNITQNTNSAAVIASIKGDNGSGRQWKLGQLQLHKAYDIDHRTV